MPTTNLYVRRRVGNHDVECTISAPDPALVAQGEAWCESLRAVPGGTAAQPLPSEDPAVRVRVAGGFSGGPRGGVDIWKDGSIDFHGPRCDKWHGARRKVEPAVVQSLIASFAEARFGELPADIPGNCSDDIYTTIELRSAAGWKSTRYGQCSHPPSALLDLLSRIVKASGPNPCSW